MLDVPHLETALSGPLLHIEKKFLTAQVEIESWFREQWQKTLPHFYGSVDLRNSGFKLAPVDTNLFPAGFNNLNSEMMALCVQAVQSAIAEKCARAKRILLIPESHTRNIFYFENLAILSDILKRAGFDVRIASMIPDLKKPFKQILPSGYEILLEPLIRQDDRIGVDHYFPCCIVLNNDLSSGIPEIFRDVKQMFMPALNLGWSTRLKSNHFRLYNDVCNEFSSVIDLDPWLINPYFDHCDAVDFTQVDSVQCLADSANQLLQKITKKYVEYKIDRKPFLAVKSDQGTYGMAVMMIQDAKELLYLNRKQRAKMAVSKGGQAVTKTIIQEGVYTFETVEDAVAEPVVYHIGRYVVGGFYRIHKNRGVDENLNAPGMDFQPLAFAKHCCVPPHIRDNLTEPVNRFYTYGVVSRLAMVAAARE